VLGSRPGHFPKEKKKKNIANFGVTPRSRSGWEEEQEPSEKPIREEGKRGGGADRMKEKKKKTSMHHGMSKRTPFPHGTRGEWDDRFSRKKVAQLDEGGRKIPKRTHLYNFIVRVERSQQSTRFLKKTEVLHTPPIFGRERNPSFSSRGREVKGEPTLRSGKLRKGQRDMRAHEKGGPAKGGGKTNCGPERKKGPPDEKGREKEKRVHCRRRGKKRNLPAAKRWGCTLRVVKEREQSYKQREEKFTRIEIKRGRIHSKVLGPKIHSGWMSKKTEEKKIRGFPEKGVAYIEGSRRRLESNLVAEEGKAGKEKTMKKGGNFLRCLLLADRGGWFLDREMLEKGR